jgi:rfaE bifunctional protein nucleotidyltransferase chain/domain
LERFYTLFSKDWKTSAILSVLCGAKQPVRTPESKILSRPALQAERERLRRAGRVVAFTNGCFDLVHAGHVSTISFARRQGDVLILGINSDASVRRLKGDKRPLVEASHRALMMAGLEAVDYVVVFDETEVTQLVADLSPDVLVKGADQAARVVGREIVEGNGGRVVVAPLVEGLSTSQIIERVVRAYGRQKENG